MKGWKFSWFSWLVVSLYIFFVGFFLYVCSWSFGALGGGGFVSPFICLDSVSVYLVFLTVVIAVGVVSLKPWIKDDVFFVVMLSQVFSILCYVCCHALFFWLFYELSIVSLLFLLIKDSPYSERYLAFWYFLGYVVFCSLPMLAVFLYFCLGCGSFSVLCWDLQDCDSWVLFLLSVLFITKIPLFPFHSWLPIVHAEAESVVSVCLSGYIMKLGVLGVFRFCSWVLPSDVLCLEYVGLVVFVSLFFFICSSFELDGKRWLAFLSLGHISVVPLCFCVSSGNGFDVGFCYCLGHGVSAAATFLLLWFLSDVVGSRNWVVLKGSLSSSFFWQVVLVCCLCLCSSFPVSLQFFCELFILYSVGCYSGVVFFLFCVYLVFSGLVPFVCLGFVLVRRQSLRCFFFNYFGPLLVVVCLCFVGFSCFLLF